MHMYNVTMALVCAHAGNNSAWNTFLKRDIKQWSSYFSTWLVNGTRLGHPVHVVKYEDLKADTLGEVKKMLDFLQFRYEEEDLKKSLANSNNFDAFHRYLCVLIRLIYYKMS